MIYFIAVSGLFHILIFFWYDLTLEDEYLRSSLLSAKEKEIVHSLIIKNSPIRSLFRVKMFSIDSWRINKRINNCLVMYFFSIFQFWIVVGIYLIFFN